MNNEDIEILSFSHKWFCRVVVGSNPESCMMESGEDTVNAFETQ